MRGPEPRRGFETPAILNAPFEDIGYPAVGGEGGGFAGCRKAPRMMLPRLPAGRAVVRVAALREIDVSGRRPAFELERLGGVSEISFGDEARLRFLPDELLRCLESRPEGGSQEIQNEEAG